MYRVINKVNNEVRHMLLSDVLELIGKSLQEFRSSISGGLYEDENYIVGQMGRVE